MITVYNLIDGTEQTYGPGVTPEMAVYVSDSLDNGKGVPFTLDETKLLYGKYFVTCGDFTARYK